MGKVIKIDFRPKWDGKGLLVGRHYTPCDLWRAEPVETIRTVQEAQARADQWEAWNNERWKDDAAWERAREYAEDARDGVYPSNNED